MRGWWGFGFRSTKGAVGGSTAEAPHGNGPENSHVLARVRGSTPDAPDLRSMRATTVRVHPVSA
ncbi:hypothetical protein GCM10027444_04950 [Actinopolyspora lacussalsi]